MVKIIDLAHWDKYACAMAIDLRGYYGQHTAPKYTAVMGCPVANLNTHLTQTMEKP